MVNGALESAARPRSDAELVLGARAGGRQAFAELVDRYKALAFGIAYGLTGSLSESDEIAQEAFCVAWQRLAHLDHPEHFRRWLCGITRNIAKRLRAARSRKGARQTTLEASLEIA